MYYYRIIIFRSSLYNVKEFYMAFEKDIERTKMYDYEIQK